MNLTEITPKEREVLQLIAKGYKNNKIGNILHLSEHTVKSHVSNLIMKLNANNRTHLSYMYGLSQTSNKNCNL